MARIAYLEDLLANPEKILSLVREDAVALKEKFADKRRTHISSEGVTEIREEDLTPNIPVLIIVTQNSYVKRTAAKQFRAQGRGGRGVIGMATRDEDEIAHLLFAHTHDHLLFFTNQGRVYADRVWNLPEASAYRQRASVCQRTQPGRKGDCYGPGAGGKLPGRQVHQPADDARPHQTAGTERVCQRARQRNHRHEP